MWTYNFKTIPKNSFLCKFLEILTATYIKMFGYIGIYITRIGVLPLYC